MSPRSKTTGKLCVAEISSLCFFKINFNVKVEMYFFESTFMAERRNFFNASLRTLCLRIFLKHYIFATRHFHYIFIGNKFSVVMPFTYVYIIF
jgi:hypothetical protein